MVEVAHMNQWAYGLCQCLIFKIALRGMCGLQSAAMGPMWTFDRFSQKSNKKSSQRDSGKLSPGKALCKKCQQFVSQLLMESS